MGRFLAFPRTIVRNQGGICTLPKLTIGGMAAAAEGAHERQTSELNNIPQGSGRSSLEKGNAKLMSVLQTGFLPHPDGSASRSNAERSSLLGQGSTETRH